MKQENAPLLSDPADSRREKLEETENAYALKRIAGGVAALLICAVAVVFVGLAATAGVRHSGSKNPDADATAAIEPVADQETAKIVKHGMDLALIKPLHATAEAVQPFVLEVTKLNPHFLQGRLSGEAWTSEFGLDAEKKMLHFETTQKKTGKREVFSSSAGQRDGKAGEKTADNHLFTTECDEEGEGLSAFLRSQAAQHMVEVSFQLAERGLVGPAAPVLKGYHTMARHLADKIEVQFDMPARLTKISEMMTTRKNELFTADAGLFRDCQEGDEYYDCECEFESCEGSENECVGLCGLDCMCWAFVCGNCDCQCFCYDHDLDCSCVEGGLTSYECLAIWEYFDACCNA